MEKHQGNVCVCVWVGSNMNDAQWHRKGSEVRWLRYAEDAACVREITFNLNSQPYLGLLVEATPTAAQLL